MAISDAHDPAFEAWVVSMTRTWPVKRALRGWRARQDSNLWPSAPEAEGMTRNTCDINQLRRVLTFPGNFDGPDWLSGTICSISRPPNWDSKTAVAARIASGTWPRV